jgi:hypothetical protein
MTDAPKRIWIDPDSWEASLNTEYVEYIRADLAAELVRAGMEAAYVDMKVFAPHEEHNTGPEHDIGYASGYHTAMNRVSAVSTDPEAIAAIVAKALGEGE